MICIMHITEKFDAETTEITDDSAADYGNTSGQATLTISVLSD